MFYSEYVVVVKVLHDVLHPAVENVAELADGADLYVFVVPQMYAIVCGTAWDALDAMSHTPENAMERLWLEEALRKAEELYLTAGE